MEVTRADGDGDGGSTYLGLESVRHGDTAQCVDDIMTICFPQAELVADLTWGLGRFWNREAGKRLQVIGLDIDRDGKRPPHIQHEYQHVPLKDQSVDVAAFDPPFIWTRGLRGITGSKRMFLGKGKAARAYAGQEDGEAVFTTKSYEGLLGQTVNVALEMRRVARQGCILKGQDLVDRREVCWWSYDTIRLMENLFGLRPFDRLLQVSPAARMRDPRWKQQRHFRRREAIYLVYKF